MWGEGGVRYENARLDIFGTPLPPPPQHHPPACPTPSFYESIFSTPYPSQSLQIRTGSNLSNFFVTTSHAYVLLGASVPLFDKYSPSYITARIPDGAQSE